MSRRGRRAGRASAEMEELSSRMPDHQDELRIRPETDTGALLQALATLGTRESVKPPSYIGEGDVDLFLQQFNDVRQANRWSDRQALLHIRAHLSGTAATCGSGQEIGEVVAALKARFGKTEGQAKEQLQGMRRDHLKSLHDQAWDIARTVELGYPRISPADREQMSVDVLVRCLESKALKLHLLATKHTTLASTIKEIEDFKAAGGSDGRMPASARVAQVEGEMEDPLVALSKAVERQTAMFALLMERLMERPAASPIREDQAKKPMACFGCGGPHMKRDCLQANNNTAERQGNGWRPAQC
jgi:hypothetical protein